LYREDEFTGAWVLNSRICHIHARSEGGPRWDPAQSEDENRAAENLVLMCLEHASAIDERDSVSAYPAELLRNWKNEQIQDYQQRIAGWPLTTAMADEAVAVSLSGHGILIKDSTLNLGGEGGKSPGAGGGGGGAIGHGARAGRGGDGGRCLDIDGAPLSPEIASEALELIASIEAGNRDSSRPGAGGGGGGASGPGAVAGDGGGGGDFAHGVMSLEAGDILEVDVGTGGSGARLPGVHGVEGQDTVVRVRAPDGELKREIRASGGRGASAGKLPDDWLVVEEDDLRNGFQISILTVANAIEFRDGLFFVLGGGWNEYGVPAVPHETVLPVLCTANWGALSATGTRGLQLCLADPSGVEVSRLALSLPQEALPHGQFMWAQAIGAPLACLGRWTLSIQSGAYLLSRIFLTVKLTADA
jgi:hypothetical protein